jgi:hypothetical protein
MKAIVTKAFPGVPDGQIHVRQFAIGDEVDGNLAAVAVEQKWAKAKGSKGEGPVSPLAKLTIAELNAIAADKGIDVSTASNKAEIIDLIETAAA